MKYNLTISVAFKTAAEAAIILDYVLQSQVFDGHNTGYVTVDITDEYIEED